MEGSAPGTLVDIGGTRLHFQIEGRGRPVVVLEAGIAASSVSWCLVRPLIAEFTTVLSYDRAGFGWSDPPPHRCTAADAASDLEKLLERCGLDGPFVLVGHSFGGLIVRIFEQRHPERVAGMVLVDPVVRAEWRDPPRARRMMLARGVMLSRRGAWLARAGVVGFALRKLTGGATFLPKLLAGISAGPGAGVTRRLTGEVRKMPRELWPVVAGHWSREQGFRAMADYLENLPLSTTQIDEQRSMGDLPLIVLSAASASKQAVEEHRRDAALSTGGEHRIVPQSGHWILLDRPEAVAGAIRDVVELTRDRR